MGAKNIEINQLIPQDFKHNPIILRDARKISEESQRQQS